jgi:hypothetical protein
LLFAVQRPAAAVFESGREQGGVKDLGGVKYALGLE